MTTNAIRSTQVPVIDGAMAVKRLGHSHPAAPDTVRLRVATSAGALVVDLTLEQARELRRALDEVLGSAP
jgi:hypothetical protein